RRALAIRADVSRAADVRAMVESTVAGLGRVDILVNNAGIRKITPFLDISEEEWDEHLNIDLKGPFLATQEAAKAMIRQGTGGAIINITSVASEQAVEGRGHYCSAKGGLKMMTKVAAIELARYGIRVNAIAPGSVDTNMMAPVKANPKAYEAFQRRVPIGRWAQPEDLVGTAVFLASDDSAYVTGVNLPVDGGHLAGPPAHGEAETAKRILTERRG
ncbi:MAG TPA: SDR family oxidoreductase, partial [Dehalococcoidia bacterium]|nr:SDR family oxidoreductase [Dehalococcoidia bacterium]